LALIWPAFRARGIIWADTGIAVLRCGVVGFRQYPVAFLACSAFLSLLILFPAFTFELSLKQNTAQHKHAQLRTREGGPRSW
jgi:hypothetical protein